MTAMTTLPFRPEGWTVDDLGDLPDDGFRYELLDGALLVTPPPELLHQYAAHSLAAAVQRHLPARLAVVTAPGLYYDPRNYRIPDVVVFPRELLGRPRHRLRPTDVVIAVEITSPGSERTDRVLKPAEYAAAGVPHFWRLDLEPLQLVTHDLDEGVYRETGRYDDEVRIEQPVPLILRLADLQS